MTYKPQSIPGQPDSVIKHQKFSDLMQRYHGQMENALYAAEITCGIQNELPVKWLSVPHFPHKRGYLV